MIKLHAPGPTASNSRSRRPIGFAYVAIFEIMHVLGKYYYLHLTDENTEAQKGQMTGLRSHSKFITETVPGHGSPNSPFSVALPAL